MTDRQARNLPLDAHLHTNLSPDSEVQIDTFASQAVERGIAEIAITDHVDFEPGAPAHRYASFADRERTVREAGDRWADHGLAIRFGAEITWDSRWADDIRDHIVGLVAEIPDPDQLGALYVAGQPRAVDLLVDDSIAIA